MLKKTLACFGLIVIGFGQAFSQLYIPNGDAVQQGSCFRLTQDAGFRNGSVWYSDKVNLKESFDLYFDIFLGCKDSDGADGIAFVLQPISTNIGVAGGGIGYQGVTPSVAVEIDTWQNGDLNDPSFDHVAVQLNGNTTHGAGGGTVAGPFTALASGGNIEDCNWHKMRVTWNADTMVLRAYIDCNLRISYVGDIITNVFGGDSLVFWGFTSATGGFWNEHRFCLDYISFTESQQDTAICRGQSVPLTVGSGDTFLWRPGTSLNDSTAANPVATPDTTTTYTVTVTDACGNLRFDTVTVYVQTDTALDVIPDNFDQCNPGQPVTLTATSLPFSNYIWSNGTVGNVTTVTGPGTYVVGVSNFCTTFFDTVQVTLRPVPTLTVQPTNCAGTGTGSATFINTGIPLFRTSWYTLSNGALLQQQTLGSPVANFNNLQPGAYLLIASNGAQCRDTIPFQITSPPPLQLQVLASIPPNCFGGTTGVVTVAATGGTGTKQYRLNGGPFQPSPTFSNLAAGTYTIVATDQNGCTTSTTVTLTQPPQIQLQAQTIRGVDCFGANTGAVTMTASQGNLPYQFSLGGGPLQVSPAFSGLVAGTYPVIVQDALGCQAQIQVTISQPTAITASFQVNQVDCAGDASGAITVTAGGGVPGYQFAIQGGAFGANPTFGTLTAGNYIVSVRDDSACVSQFPVQVQQPAALNLLANVQDALCFGDNSGFVQLQGQGGWAPYTYALSGGVFQANDTIFGLVAGNYTLVVRDDSLCEFTLPVAVGEPPLLEITVTDRIDVDCFGNNSGVLAVSGTGGTQPYEFKLNFLPYQASGTFPNLFAGLYTLTVRDDNGCEAEVDTFLTTPTGLAAGIDSLRDVGCFGDSTGWVQMTAFGGSAPYSYVFQGDTTQNPVFANLPALTDTLIMFDANGCLVPIPLVIAEPPVLDLSLAAFKDLACFQSADGEARLVSTGGVTPYAFSVGGAFQNSGQFTGLTAGNFVAVVEDVNACTDTIPFVLNEPPQLLLDTLIWSQVRCFGEDNGQISVAANGGSGAYEFQFETLGWGSQTTFAQLAPGSYLVQVRDDSACVDSAIFLIEQPDSLILSPADFRDIACFGGSTGEVLVSVSGGRSPWQFRLNGGPLQSDSLFTGLNAGAYVVRVQDDSLCTDTASFLLSQPPALEIDLVLQQDVRCFGENNGRIVVTANGGVAPYQFQLSSGAPQSDTIFANLSPGLYQVILTDDSACQTVLPDLRIQEPALFTATTGSEQVRCFGESNGVVFVNLAGGNGGYLTEWFTNPVQTGDSALGLPAGSYGFRSVDSLGCEVLGEVELTEPALLEMAIDSIREAFCSWENGAAYLSATGGTGAYRFEWPGLPGLEGPAAVDVLGLTYLVRLLDERGCEDTLTVVIPDTPPADTRFTTLPDPSMPILESQNPIRFLNQTIGAVTYLWEFGDGALEDEENPSHQYELPGEYTVTLTAWNAFFVCPTTFSLTLTIIADGQIFYPNAFTPNGDGENDVFVVKGEGIAELEVLIFDRWGRLITRWTQLDAGWDGRIPGGGVAQEGVYTFAVKARTNAGAQINHGGTVTLIR